MVWTVGSVSSLAHLHLHILDHYIRGHLLGWESLVSRRGRLFAEIGMAGRLAALARVRATALVAGFCDHQSPASSFLQAARSELVRVRAGPRRVDLDDVCVDAVSDGLVHERGLANEGGSL